MTIRTKVWLLAAIVAVTAGATVWLHAYALRRELTRQAKDAAIAVVKEIADTLVGLDANAEDHDLAYVLQTYSARHARIQLIELHVQEDAATGSALSIVAPRGDQAEIRRLTPAIRLVDRITREPTGDNTYPLQQVVDLQGARKATLLLHWNLGAVEAVLLASERWAMLLGAVQLVALVLLVGFLVDRTVVKRLDALGAAMRDVEGGDLGRRVQTRNTEDEVGRLSHGFNRMLDQLSAADSEIRAFNQRLAQEIAAATQDLSTKNVALAQMNRLLIDLRRENASRVRLATLGQLAAQLAHEIGTPLSSVNGHLQLALLQRDLPQTLRERLEVSVREIARIGRIVRDYLDSTRSMEPERKPASLRKILVEAVEVAGGDREGADVLRADRAPIAVQIGADPPDFHTDAGLLRQIVINLLTNGLDAVEKGGRVSLTSSVQQDEVVILVRDTGTGIPPDDLRRIFEPFYTTKGRGKGTGLGLAICRELVAALGAKIEVESTAGEGSVFTVRLPLRAQSPAGESRPLAAAGGNA
jgi:two-component system NtrC family sensor kinase